jgi:nitrogen fixation protein FixH
MATRIHPWALGIGIVIVVFLVATITVTVWIGGQDVNMVRRDYYEKDQRYQDEIAVRSRTAALAQKPAIALDDTRRLCTLRFPEGTATDSITGEVTFFRADNDRSDFTKPLALGTDGTQQFSLDSLARGQWIVKLRWLQRGSEYYVEERLFLR